jgi:hypothetical protein
MKEKVKLKLILCIFLVFSGIFGIFFNQFNVKYNYNSKTDVISDLKSASGNWKTLVTRSVGNDPRTIFIGDANNDGYNDIVTANSGSDDISILLWNSTSDDWDPQITKSVGDSPESIFIGDANNDGYYDIAIANRDSHDVSILTWNNASGDWDPQITKSVGDCASVFIGDANNDGDNDIATANVYANDVSILIWNSTSDDWNPQITQSVTNGPYSVFIGDANNDGDNDIATANVFSDDISILLWNSTSDDWDPQITKSVGGYPSSLFIGDANNDGDDDIAITNLDDHEVSILIWNSTSSDWNPQITLAVGNFPQSVFIGDANNDGDNDIATANGGSDDVSILIWNSTSNDWNPQITRAVADGPISIFIGDTNNDGDNDIATANGIPNVVSILLWEPAFLSIISPENTAYGPLKGYYPATHGFDNDEDGDNPERWLLNKAGGTIQVLDSHNAHKKVVELHELSDDLTSISNVFDSRTNGTFECWVMVNRMDDWFSLGSFNGDTSDGILISFSNDGNITYNIGGGNWITITSYSINIWYHFRIEWDCETDWHLWIDGVSQDGGSGYSYRNSPPTVDRVRFEISNAGTSQNQYMYVDAVGYSWDPAYEIGDNLEEGLRLSYYNNTHLDWIAYSLDGQDNKTIFDQEIIPLPEEGDHTIQLFGRDAESGEILKTEIQYFSIDTISPEILIYSPIADESFGLTPKYNISIIESHLESIWYTIDGGVTNYTIDELNGTIDQYAWSATPFGPVILSFYAKDVTNNTGYKEVTITKLKLLNMDILNMSLTSSEFKVEFYVYNESANAIDFASIQMWWNGTNVSSGLQNHGNGDYFISLEPITVAPGEDPILLNMTISASGYEDKYFETYISVEPPEIVKFLQFAIIDHSYSLEHFNFTFFLCNEEGQGIDSATFQLRWDSIDYSSAVQNLGNGYYFVSLDPILVTPGEDPILLNMTISASGYESKYFEIHVAIDPDTLQKGAQERSEEFPLLLIVTISVVSVGVITGVVGIFWFRKRGRKQI